MLHKRSMVMVSENQSGNLSCAPLQCLQFPTMTVTENIVKKKLKIKIASKQLEAKPGAESCKFGLDDECGHSYPEIENNKTDVIQSHKFVKPSFGDKKLSAADDDNLQAKSSAISSHKRKFPGIEDGQKEKRRKMDRGATRHCSSILRQLMTHPNGWVFNQAVDPVKLNIPDYFSVISEPMDLGTIKSKLEKNTYSSVEEFAADVRLTFSNAMEYNPPPNEVHQMAKTLSGIFKTRWNCLEAKWNRESTNEEQGSVSNGRAKNANLPEQKKSPMHVSLFPETMMSAEEKQKLRKQLLELSREKMPPHLQGLLKKSGFKWQREGRIELDISTIDDETLRELKEITKCSFGARAAKAVAAKKTENGRRQSSGKIGHRGTDSDTRSASGSANVNLPLNLVTAKCALCGNIRCECSLQSNAARTSSTDLSSDRSLRQDHVDASRMKPEVKTLSTSQISKSDPESVDWTPLIDIQLSPKKALRAAMLKSRFADTIFKAKQKTLVDYVDKADPLRMQKEKERLEKQQREEKAKIEAQIRAAEAATRMKAQAELKMQRERQREAARLALQKMAKTVEIDDNLEILKDLEMLTGSSLSDSSLGTEQHMGPLEGVQFGNPLERLGLFMKDEYIGDGDDGEDGEIFS